MTFVRFVAYIWVNYKVLVLVAVMAAKTITALYLRAIGYDRWFTALIPFGWFVYGGDASVPVLLLLARVIMELFFITSYQLVFFILAIALYVWTVYLAADVYVNYSNPKLFAAIPFYKYYIMIKEVLRIARNEPG